MSVGGTIWSRSASAQTATSNDPAPPNWWPVADFVDDTTSVRAWSPKTSLMACVSAASPCGVEVPCGLM